jgi:hypothetical protein
MIFIQIETMEDIRSLLVSINQMHAKELSNSFENFSSSPHVSFIPPLLTFLPLHDVSVFTNQSLEMWKIYESKRNRFRFVKKKRGGLEEKSSSLFCVSSHLKKHVYKDYILPSRYQCHILWKNLKANII